MSRQSYTVDFDKTVPAGTDKSIVIRHGGLLLSFLEATAPFDYEMDDEGKNAGRPGMVITRAFGDEFRKVTLYNRSGTAALRVEGVVGRAGVSYDYLRTRSTRIVPQSTTLATASNFTVPGIASQTDIDTYGLSAAPRRKHVIVTNTHATAELWLFKNGISFGRVYALRERIVEGDDDFVVANSSGVSILVAMEKHYYL